MDDRQTPETPDAPQPDERSMVRKVGAKLIYVVPVVILAKLLTARPAAALSPGF